MNLPSFISFDSLNNILKIDEYYPENLYQIIVLIIIMIFNVL